MNEYIFQGIVGMSLVFLALIYAYIVYRRNKKWEKTKNIEKEKLEEEK